MARKADLTKALDTAVTRERKLPALRAETRTYTIEGADLAEWVSGSENRFRVTAIEFDNVEDCFVVTVSSEKQAELPRISTRGAARRGSAEKPFASEAEEERDRVARMTSGPAVLDDTGLTPEDEGYTGAHVTEVGEGGDVDDVPSQIPDKLESVRARTRTRRVGGGRTL